LLTFAVLAAWAGVLATHDWRWRQLPNWLLGYGALIGAIHWAATGHLPYGAGWQEGLLAAGASVMVLWPLYRMGWMGAGDVKFTAVIGWLGGVKMLLTIFLGASVLGGVLALAIMHSRLSPYLSARSLDTRLRGRVPQGVALAMVFIGYTAVTVQSGLS
jgi:prepilin peptidase CpaA